MKLSEIGNAVQPYTLEVDEETTFYNFKTTNGLNYKVRFDTGMYTWDMATSICYIDPNSISSEVQDVIARREGKDTMGVELSFAMIREKSPGYEVYEFDVLNLEKNVVYEVFATVQDIVADFLQKYDEKLSYLVFSAKGESRKHLYDHFAKTLHKTLEYIILTGRTPIGEKTYLLINPYLMGY